MELARRTGPVAAGRIFVIGDTPYDVEAAGAIDARTIAVATGGYSVEELSAHHPWRVFPELPPPSEFLRLIDEPVFAQGSTARPASAQDASARQASDGGKVPAADK